MVSAEGGYWSVMPGLLVLAVGIGLLMSPSTTAITESLPVEKQGVASALNDTVRELGGAVGIALLGSLVNAGYRSSVSSATATLAPDVAHQVEDGIGSAFAAAPQLGDDGARPCSLAARDALVDGWRLSMWFGVVLAAVAFVYLVMRGPRTRRPRLTSRVEPAAATLEPADRRVTSDRAPSEDPGDQEQEAEDAEDEHQDERRQQQPRERRSRRAGRRRGCRRSAAVSVA